MINLRTAKALGLTIPPSLLVRADQIIESPDLRAAPHPHYVSHDRPAMLTRRRFLGTLGASLVAGPAAAHAPAKARRVLMYVSDATFADHLTAGLRVIAFTGRTEAESELQRMGVCVQSRMSKMRRIDT